MPDCDMCGEKVEEVTKCKMCGEKFCADCGEADQKLCIYCADEDEEEDDEQTRISSGF